MPLLKDDIGNVPEEVWHRAVEREKVIRELALCKRITKERFSDALEELSLSRSQVYALLKRYRQRPVTSTLVPSPPGRYKGSQKLDPKVGDIIHKAINELYLTKQRPKVSQLCRDIAHNCKAIGLAPPSRKAIQSRINLKSKIVREGTRLGHKVASDRYDPRPGSYLANYALEIVQIDHALVDKVVLDECNREPIGRPWITLGIDICSRAVTGLHLTMESPSTTSVGLMVSHSVLPKEQWLANLGITAAWPVYGLPTMLHMDNGKEFHSIPFTQGCQEHGINRKYRPPATPHYGAHIERLIGTMMGEVHLLPGTTFSNIQEKGDYDPISNSAMTLAELERWIAIQIVGRYHAQLHSGIGLSPNVAWQRAVQERPNDLRLPHNLDQFLIDFLPFQFRSVRRDGIHLFNIRYWDAILTQLICEDEKIKIKYDPRDLSIVWARFPDGSYFRIPYADLGRPAISLWEHRRAITRLRSVGKSSVNEELIFAAVEAQRALIQESQNKTIRARRDAARIRILEGQGANTQPRLHEICASNIPLTTNGDRYLPYDMEEWG